MRKIQKIVRGLSMAVPILGEHMASKYSMDGSKVYTAIMGPPKALFLSGMLYDIASNENYIPFMLAYGALTFQNYIYHSRNVIRGKIPSKI